VNKTRRKEIDEVHSTLMAVNQLLEILQDEEQAYLDNNLSPDQHSSKAIAAEQAADALWDARHAIDDAIGHLRKAVSR
jgi:hypothetical protein